MTQQEQIYGPYIGTIGQTEEQTPDGKASYWRIELIGPEGRGQWFSAFGNTPKIMLSQPGATWACTYTVWTGTNGNQRYTIKDAQTSGSADQPQAPAQHMPVDQTPMPQAQPPQARQASSAPAWSLNMDDRGRSIIRQVAFKEIADKDGKSGEQLNDLTDLYESIILAAYQPVPDAPSDDGFIQHEL